MFTIPVVVVTQMMRPGVESLCMWLCVLFSSSLSAWQTHSISDLWTVLLIPSICNKWVSLSHVDTKGFHVALCATLMLFVALEAIGGSELAARDGGQQLSYLCALGGGVFCSCTPAAVVASGIINKCCAAIEMQQNGFSMGVYDQCLLAFYWLCWTGRQARFPFQFHETMCKTLRQREMQRLSHPSPRTTVKIMSSNDPR